MAAVLWAAGTAGTVTSMVVITTLLVATLRAREHKSVRAASLPLLYVVLAGSALCCLESLARAADVTSLLAHLLGLWCRHLGFSAVYGTLLLKTWRVCMILRSVRARLSRITDAQLLRKLLLLLLGVGVYLAFWSAALARHSAAPGPSQWSSTGTVQGSSEHSTGSTNATSALSTQGTCSADTCTASLWDVAMFAFELSLLALCGVYCYQACRAPGLFSDSTSVGLALTHQAAWTAATAALSVLPVAPSGVQLVNLGHVVRPYATALPTLLLVFLPKLLAAGRGRRVLQGVLSDVTEGRRLHKLSVVVNKRGELLTLHCVPCGPLLLRSVGGGSVVSGAGQTALSCERHYTREEVDRLIGMLQQLRAHNQNLAAENEKMRNLRYSVTEREREGGGVGNKTGGNCVEATPQASVLNARINNFWRTTQDTSVSLGPKQQFHNNLIYAQASNNAFNNSSKVHNVFLNYGNKHHVSISSEMNFGTKEGYCNSENMCIDSKHCGNSLAGDTHTYTTTPVTVLHQRVLRPTSVLKDSVAEPPTFPRALSLAHDGEVGFASVWDKSKDIDCTNTRLCVLQVRRDTEKATNQKAAPEVTCWETNQNAAPESTCSEANQDAAPEVTCWETNQKVAPKVTCSETSQKVAPEVTCWETNKKVVPDVIYCGSGGCEVSHTRSLDIQKASCRGGSVWGITALGAGSGRSDIGLGGSFPSPFTKQKQPSRDTSPGLRGYKPKPTTQSGAQGRQTSVGQQDVSATQKI